MKTLRVLVLWIGFVLSVSLSNPYLVAKENQHRIAAGYRLRYSSSIAKRRESLLPWKRLDHNNHSHSSDSNFWGDTVPEDHERKLNSEIGMQDVSVISLPKD
jgi:hypothetical protein